MSDFEELLAAAGRRLGRLPLEQMTVRAGERNFVIEAVRDQDQLMAAAEAQRVSPFPYGLLLWEAGVALADVVAAEEGLPGVRLLELGAGSGLVGIVAAAGGAQVVQTDHSYEALALCRRNAAANGVTGIDLRAGDWTAWTDTGPYDVVLAADVLYEPDLYGALEKVLDVTVRPGGLAILTDPGRIHAGLFVAQLEDAGWAVESQQVVVAAVPPCAEGSTVCVTVIKARRRISE